LSESLFWVTYFAAFAAMLIFGLLVKRRLWLASIVIAATSSVALAALTIGYGGRLADPWLPVALFINFGMSWFAAAAAVYVVKFVHA
jgi:hypothetical protein